MNVPHTFEVWYWFSQMAMPVVTVAAAFFAWMAYRQVRAQTIAGNMFELLKYIQSDSFVHARRVVIVDLEKRPYAEWSKEDRAAAADVAGSYDIMARVLKAGLVPVKFAVPPAAPSIKRTYKILAPLFQEFRKQENMGPSYWSDFSWLHDEACRMG